MHEFVCSHIYDDGQYCQWLTSCQVLREGPETHEILVNGRGSEYRVVLGRSTTGLYMCIPTMNVGCGLSHLSDIFWNTSRIAEVLNETDAVTIATAISYYEQMNGEFPCD